MPRRSLALAALLLVIPANLPAADGDRDPKFDGDGRATFLPVGLPSRAAGYRVSVLADGSLLVGGTALFDFKSYWPGVARVLANGALDSSFGDSGWVTNPFVNGSLNSLNAILSLEDGRILLAGMVDAIDPVLARLHIGGTPDLTFGPFGVRTLAEPPFTYDSISIKSAVLDREGKVVVAVRCYDCAGAFGTRLLLTRLDIDGNPDTDFGFEGWSLIDYEPGLETLCSYSCRHDLPLAVDESGRILVAVRAGEENLSAAIVRLLPTGDLDPSFGDGDGVAEVGVALGYPSGLAIHPNSGAVLVGLSDTQGGSGVVQLESDGDIDTTFGTLGFVDLVFNDGTDLGEIAVQSDGKIVAVGGINLEGPERGGFFLARLLPDGALDPTFDNNGVVRHEFNLETQGFDAAIALALSGGRAVAVGVAENNADSGPWGHFAVLRTQSALIFTDGFERGSTSGWLGN